MKQNTLYLLLLLAAQLPVLPSAQAFPDRPIKLLVPSPAGSPPDMMARLLTDKMAASLGQPVIVENKPGAGGTIGAKAVTTAEPDGHARRRLLDSGFAASRRPGMTTFIESLH